MSLGYQRIFFLARPALDLLVFVLEDPDTAVECLDHLLGLVLVNDKQPTPFEHIVQRIDDLVESSGRSTLLRKSHNA